MARPRACSAHHSTTAEINRERYALKATRGDSRRLDTISPDTTPRQRAEAASDAAMM